MPTLPCPYCAEQIQSEAIICRFCGAHKEDGVWLPPMPAKPPPGAHILQNSGWLFLLSGLFELYSLTEPVPLFGAMRGGVVANLFHLIFAGLYIASGIGLIQLRYWGYQSLIAATAVYTVERFLYLADTKARAAELQGELGMFSGIFGSTNSVALDSSVQTWVLVVLLTWWAFALYAYFRRNSFRR